MEKYRGLISLFSQKGFSLFEMLVVLVIIGLMSAFVLPQMAGPLMKMKARTSAGKVAAALRYARSRAVAEKIPYVAVLDWEHKRIRISDYPSLTGDLLSDTEAEHPSPEENRAKIYDMPEGVRMLKGEGLAEGPETSSHIVFYSSGGSSGGEIVIADEKDRAYLLHTDFITGAVAVHE